MLTESIAIDFFNFHGLCPCPALKEFICSLIIWSYFFLEWISKSVISLNTEVYSQESSLSSCTPNFFHIPVCLKLSLTHPNYRDTLRERGVGEIHRGRVWWGLQQETPISTIFPIRYLSCRTILAVITQILLFIVCSLFKIEVLWAPWDERC